MTRYEHRVLAFQPEYPARPVGKGFECDRPDLNGLVKAMHGELEKLQTEGWAVVAATGVLGGGHGYAGGLYGFSTTDGIVVILRRELPA